MSTPPAPSASTPPATAPHRRIPFTVVFLHIPKTAGLSLRHLLLKAFGGTGAAGQRGVFRIIHPIDDTARLGRLPPAAKRSLTLIEGHLYYGVHELVEQLCAYVTMLRDPVERCLSYYSHIRERPEHHLHAAVSERNLSLAGCIREKLTIELDNFMVRALTSLRNVHVPVGGVTREMLAEAKANLDRVTVLGITERFDESIDCLSRAFGLAHSLPANTPRINISANRFRRESMSAEDLALLEASNALDRELYDHAAALFDNRVKRHATP